MSTSIQDTQRVTVSGGTIEVDGILYSAPPFSRLKEGDTALAKKTPESFTMGGKRVVIVRREYWTEIT